jgi:DNA-binding NtrC family response regulator
MVPPTASRGRILIVDDDPTIPEILGAALEPRGFEVVGCGSAQEALTRLSESEFDAIATDLNMPGMTGLELCARVVADSPDVPVIVLTAYGSLDAAIGAIRAGAYDFLVKPPEVDALAVALDRAIQHRALRREVRRLRQAVAQAQRFDELLGASNPMRALFDLLERAAASDASVLITGETGTGKELVARALHSRSARAARPFVAINCAALPETLLESELFGHAKGAFTDARTAHAGLLVRASGGTLFLDEIGDMPAALQVKLLRALQERTVRPVGALDEVKFDARVIAATHRDIETAVAEGRFRQDLFFRLNVITVPVPPLRARPGDILLLARHFLETFAARSSRPVTGITPAAAERLLAYTWPGNVRELQNSIERAVALTRNDHITVEDLPEKIRAYRAPAVPIPEEESGELATMEEVERRHILRVLAAVQGNKASAARILGFDRATLYRKLERFGV